MKGKRIFERFGFNAEKTLPLQRQESRIITNFEEWEFNPKKCDWQNIENEESLTGYKMNSQLLAILENAIDLTKH
jgi:hypothetical protein